MRHLVNEHVNNCVAARPGALVNSLQRRQSFSSLTTKILACVSVNLRALVNAIIRLSFKVRDETETVARDDRTETTILD